MTYVDFIEFRDYGGQGESGFFGRVVMREDVRGKDPDEIQATIDHGKALLGNAVVACEIFAPPTRS